MTEASERERLRAAVPSVAAIVVHYRTPARLLECLAALERQRQVDLEILVVDNSGSAEAAPEPAPAAAWRLHCAERNLGYGQACNLGASLTASEHLLFLNADLTLAEDACARLCGASADDPSVGVVGPRVYGADGEVELSARAFPSARTAVLGRSSLITSLLRRAGGAPPALAAALGGRVVTVDWVSGACMLIRRRAFEDVGGFDERYWMYWEDADMCRRLRSLGWRTIFCPAAQARHSTGSSGRSEHTIRAFHDSASRYYAQHAARNRATAAVARALLRARMKVMLSRHARRAEP